MQTTVFQRHQNHLGYVTPADMKVITRTLPTSLVPSDLPREGGWIEGFGFFYPTAEDARVGIDNFLKSQFDSTVQMNGGQTWLYHHDQPLPDWFRQFGFEPYRVEGSRFIWIRPLVN